MCRMQGRYADRQDVFVGANNFVYWEEGNRDRKLSLDMYVCFGARNVDRRSYKTWDEGGIAPQVVFGVTSNSSRFTDQGSDKSVYEALGVEEYYRFDPLYEPIPSGFLAFRSKRSELQPVAAKRLFSPRLGLDLRAEGPLLRLFLPGSGQRLLTYHEAVAARQEAEAARQRAELLAARLQAELAELKRQK